MNYRFDWAPIWANRDLIIAGTLTTIEICGVSLIASMLLGIVVGTIRASRRKSLSWAALVYVEGMRNIPLLVHLYFWYIGLAFLKLPAFACAVLGLSLYSSAYVAEIVRSGIMSVPDGQTDAGLALGLRPTRVSLLIVFPQAFRIVLPSMMSIASQLIKDTSLASVISVAELTYQASAIEGKTFRTFEIYIVVALIYLALVTIVTQASVRIWGVQPRALNEAEALRA